MEPLGSVDGQEARSCLGDVLSLCKSNRDPLDTESLSGLSLRLVKKAPRQLELTWAGSRPRSPGGNLSYELHVLNQVRARLTVYSLRYRKG